MVDEAQWGEVTYYTGRASFPPGFLLLKHFLFTALSASGQGSARGWCVKGGIMGMGAGDFWGDTGGTHWLAGLPSAYVWPGSLEAQHAWRSMEGSWRMLGLCVCWWALPDGLPWWLSC